MLDDEYETCPDCGEKKYDTLETPEYEEGILIEKGWCHNDDCRYSNEEKIRALTPEDKRKCVNCGSKFMPENSGDKFCNYCEDNKIIHDTYAHNFGILVPGETGIVYEQQTQGIRCHHVYIEGSYIPLRKPRHSARFKDDEKIPERYNFEKNEYTRNGDMLAALRNANYNYDNDQVKKIWEDLKQELKFSFKTVEPPKKQHPYNQEGIKWVEITDEGLGENLVGQTVCMVYPNCD